MHKVPSAGRTVASSDLDHHFIAFSPRMIGRCPVETVEVASHRREYVKGNKEVGCDNNDVSWRRRRKQASSELPAEWLDNLADDVTMEGSVLTGIAEGPEAVRAILGLRGRCTTTRSSTSLAPTQTMGSSRTTVGGAV